MNDGPRIDALIPAYMAICNNRFNILLHLKMCVDLHVCVGGRSFGILFVFFNLQCYFNLNKMFYLNLLLSHRF